MKVYSAEAIRLWDQYTITHEPVSSLDLMERAATACCNWLLENKRDASSFALFCGKGNNGGDGLAIARMLLEKDYPVSVFILEFGHKGTDDFQQNLARLHALPGTDIHFVQSEEHFHPFTEGQVIVDALFGTGLNRAVEGLTASLIRHMNQSGCPVISIDMPSGLFTDHSSRGNLTVQAETTLSFQCYKPAFLVAENEKAVGRVEILDIGLHPGYEKENPGRFELLDDTLVSQFYHPRSRFAHKGNFGHALLLAGSYGKTGAAILAARACFRSGAGLLSCQLPSSAYAIMQTAVPEAMVFSDYHAAFLTQMATDPGLYDACGIGPGLGTASETRAFLKELLEKSQKPLVLDADALNILATEATLFNQLPAGSILTPHPKEFERLFGASANDFDRIEKAMEKAREHQVVLLLKGHHSFIALPDGKGYFNATGNPGMATAGSGDVLTGMLTGLLAQGYPPAAAACTGVYLHGLAGDLAARDGAEESLVAGDIIDSLPAAWRMLKGLF